MKNAQDDPIGSDCKTDLPDFDGMTWPEFSAWLDAYRDAAFEAGYRLAKSELMEK